MRRCLSLPKDSLQIFPDLAQLNEIILERFSGDGVAVVAHLLRTGLRASGLLAGQCAFAQGVCLSGASAFGVQRVVRYAAARYTFDARDKASVQLVVTDDLLL